MTDFRDDEPATCGGVGYFVGPVCCGNLRNGECRIDCAVPEQTPCDGCADCKTTPTESTDAE